MPIRNRAPFLAGPNSNLHTGDRQQPTFLFRRLRDESASPSWRRIVTGNRFGMAGYSLMAVGAGGYVNVIYRQNHEYSEDNEVSYFIQTFISVLIVSIGVLFISFSELIETNKMKLEAERDLG